MNDLHDLPLFAQAEELPRQDLDQGHAGDLWLVIDPRRDGWQPGQDLTPYLERAVPLFRQKPWTAGAAPGIVRGHPDQVANGLGAAAAALGWQVVSDPKVTRNTIWLGLKGGGKQ